MTQRVSMGEGLTPLVPSTRIGKRLWFKLESCNPTGSYKDRFIAAELESILRRGARACVATSSGNTGSSLAAYCARYEVRCIIVVNADAPAGKLAQMQAHGAQVVRVANFVSDPAVTETVFAQLRRLSETRNVPLVVSAYRYCPEGMAGVEKISAELSEQVRDAGHVFVPVGGGGLFTAVVRGFEKKGRPMKVHAVQPAGCSTVAAGFLRGDREIRPVIGTTRVSGLSVPFDIDAGLALDRLYACGGHAFEAPDEEIFAAQAMLIEQEGIYCEPAGAAALAGWLRAVAQGIVDAEATAVCLVTGHGSKDPVAVDCVAGRHPAIEMDAERIAAGLEDLL